MTVNQLMFSTTLERGVIKYTDSPLLRAITYGCIILIDEADKALEHVVAIFWSLAGQNEMTLSDGQRVCTMRERESDIVAHPMFHLILLANRPGYRKQDLPIYRNTIQYCLVAFLGNHFLQVLGDNFSWLGSIPGIHWVKSNSEYKSPAIQSQILIKYPSRNYCLSSHLNWMKT